MREDGLSVAGTAAGVRTVPLSSRRVAALKEWRLRARFSRDEDLIFPSQRGGFTDHANLVKRRYRPTANGAQLA